MNLNLMMKYLTNNQVGHDNQIILIFTKHKLGKIHHSSPGGATSSGNPYNSRESPYWRKRFFTCPFILPKDSEKSTIENFSPPLQDALKIFRPPFAGR